MAEITKIEDHYQQAIDRLPMQFRDKTTIDAMFNTWFSAIQELEDDLIGIRDETKLSNAKGVNLDQYGRVLGLIRDYEESDGHFYGRIAEVLLSRASDGSTEGLRSSVETIMELNNVNVIEYNNAVEWDNNSVPYLTGGVLVFGYYHSRTKNVDSVDVDVISKACPATIGSTVFGKHYYAGNGNNLWIPCEVLLTGDDLVFRDNLNNIDNAVDELGNQIVVHANNLDRYGENWELGILPEDDIIFDELELEPSGEILEVVPQGGEAQDFNVASSGLGFHGHMLEVIATNLIV